MNRMPENDRPYRNRVFNSVDGNSVLLTSDTINISKGGSHEVTLNDHAVFASTEGEMKIKAEGRILLKGKQIIIESPDILNICQE